MGGQNSGKQVPDKLAARPLRRLASLNPKVEIYCLGDFSVRANATSSLAPLKRNSQPTALLQLLVAAGPHGVDKTEAEIKLWTRYQAELAENTLDTTVYRLRKMLGNHNTVEVANGIVRLDEAHVRIDAWVFAEVAEEFCVRMQASTRAAESNEIADRSNDLFDLYKGHFLAKDQTTPWIVQMRDALQAKFFRAIKLAGARWQAIKEWEHAVHLYERALELDNLAEEIHRELMRCHLARGEFADVVRVFRRCRELFSVVLGVGPSDATEKVYRQALAGKSFK